MTETTPETITPETAPEAGQERAVTPEPSEAPQAGAEKTPEPDATPSRVRPIHADFDSDSDAIEGGRPDIWAAKPLPAAPPRHAKAVPAPPARTVGQRQAEAWGAAAVTDDQRRAAAKHAAAAEEAAAINPSAPDGDPADEDSDDDGAPAGT